MTDIDAVLKERGSTHGDYTTQANMSQLLKNVVREQEVHCMTGPMQESIEMILHKISRIVNGNAFHKDHWDDIAGYAMLISKQLEELKDEK